MQIAKKRDVIQQIRVQIRIQHPQITQYQFSVHARKKIFFLLTSVIISIFGAGMNTSVICF